MGRQFCTQPFACSPVHDYLLLITIKVGASCGSLVSQLVSQLVSESEACYQLRGYSYAALSNLGYVLIYDNLSDCIDFGVPDWYAE